MNLTLPFYDSNSIIISGPLPMDRCDLLRASCIYREVLKGVIQVHRTLCNDVCGNNKLQTFSSRFLMEHARMLTFARCAVKSFTLPRVERRTTDLPTFDEEGCLQRPVERFAQSNNQCRPESRAVKPNFNHHSWGKLGLSLPCMTGRIGTACDYPARTLRMGAHTKRSQMSANRN